MNLRRGRIVEFVLAVQCGRWIVVVGGKSEHDQEIQQKSSSDGNDGPALQPEMVSHK